jgi:predicted nucleotidyltransferase component of viral defense system
MLEIVKKYAISESYFSLQELNYIIQLLYMKVFFKRLVLKAGTANFRLDLKPIFVSLVFGNNW